MHDPVRVRCRQLIHAITSSAIMSLLYRSFWVFSRDILVLSNVYQVVYNYAKVTASKFLHYINCNPKVRYALNSKPTLSLIKLIENKNSDVQELPRRHRQSLSAQNSIRHVGPPRVFRTLSRTNIIHKVQTTGKIAQSNI